MRLNLGVSIGAVLSTLLALSVFQQVDALTISAIPRGPQRPMGPPPQFQHRMGANARSAEEESEEDENESQARVEPQITPLNRDDCLAKLLCGMSVPVTGGGAPKNGYYSDYANIVAKFFEAFPLEDEQKSVESMEAYDDYSVEEDAKKPFRKNSKQSSGLQLFDIAVVKQATNASDKAEDDERNARSNIDLRLARARKIVNKLGEKLQTVRQCQQISGCPFTFKQLRSKLKSTPSESNSNVPSASSNTNADLHSVPPVKYTYNTQGYKPLTKGKPSPSSTELVLGGSQEPFKDTHKGDDELEEFFGPPPVFGSNGRPVQQNKQRPAFQNYHKQQVFQNGNEEYFPYNPPVRRPGSKAKVHSGSPFPKKKVGYKVPSFVKRRPSGENDEIDDVNQSAGPITLVSGDDLNKLRPQFQDAKEYEEFQQFLEFQKNKANQDDGQQDVNDTEDYDDNNNDEGSDEDYEDDGDQEEEEDEGDSNEDEEEEDEEQTSKKKKGASKDVVKTTDSPTTAKPKITSYKHPSKESFLFVEEEFPTKKNSEDDEVDHPDNAWSKLAFATSSALIKEPKNKNKTALEEKNDEKLNLSKEASKENDDDDAKSDESKSKEDEEEEDEEKQEDEVKSRSQQKPLSETDDDEAEEEKSRKRRPSKKSKNKPKLSLTDEDEFDRVTAALSKPTPKPKRKQSNKSRGSSNKSSKSKTKKEKAKKKPLSEKKPENDDTSEEVKKPTRAPLLEIGGRPLVPAPDKSTTGLKAKKTGPLSRFKFSLVRPYGVQTKEEHQAETYQHSTQSKPSLPYPSSSSSYSKPNPSGSSSNAFRHESIVGNSGGSGIKNKPSYSSSYTPSSMPSFGSNNGKFGNKEFSFNTNPSAPQSSSKPQSLITFPFASPLSTLKTLFKRPNSSNNQDVHGAGNMNAPLAPVTAFVHRPAGPESNSFKRYTPEPDRSRSDEIISKPKAKKNSKSKSSKKNYRLKANKH